MRQGPEQEKESATMSIQAISAYKGVYINLERNPERKERLVAHLEEMGVADAYARHAAVDGRSVATTYSSTLSPGQLGCWLSHLGVLQAHKQDAVDLHVIEDDVKLSKDFISSVRAISANLDERHVTWDIVFTDVIVIDDVKTHAFFSTRLKNFERNKSLSLVPLKDLQFAGTSSMLINRRSIQKCANFLSEGWKANVPIDIYIRDLVHQRKLNAFVTIPFLSSVSDLSAQSDICGPQDRSKAIYEVLRQAFFIDADLPKLLTRSQELTADSVHSPVDRIFMQAVGHTLGDHYKQF